MLSKLCFENCQFPLSISLQCLQQTPCYLPGLEFSPLETSFTCLVHILPSTWPPLVRNPVLETRNEERGHLHVSFLSTHTTCGEAECVDFLGINQFPSKLRRMGLSVKVSHLLLVGTCPPTPYPIDKSHWVARILPLASYPMLLHRQLDVFG